MNKEELKDKISELTKNKLPNEMELLEKIIKETGLYTYDVTSVRECGRNRTYENNHRKMTIKDLEEFEQEIGSHMSWASIRTNTSFGMCSQNLESEIDDRLYNMIKDLIEKNLDEDFIEEYINEINEIISDEYTSEYISLIDSMSKEGFIELYKKYV